MTADKTEDMEPLGPLAWPQPAALVDEADETRVVLRVNVGYYFDVEGTLDLHESGKVTLHPKTPDWLNVLRAGYLMCWRGDDSRPQADILRELPTRWKTYLWASVTFDHTGDTTAQTEQQ